MPNRYILLATALLLNGCDVTNPSLTGQARPAPPVAAKVPDPIPLPTPAPAPTKVPTPPPAPTPAATPPLPRVSHFPAKSKVAAIAFEDTNPGDEDFNDFLADFSINETIDANDNLTHITVDFYPRAVGAWYDSELLLLLNGVKGGKTNLVYQQPQKPLFFGPAKVTLIHYDGEGTVLDRSNLDANSEVVVFASTHALFGVRPETDRKSLVNTYADLPLLTTRQNARVDIELQNPAANHVTGRDLDVGRYRMVLHVKPKHASDTYVDLIDVDPSSYDAKGFPHGFVVQSDWQWPREGVNIDQVYGKFDLYRQYLLDKKIHPEATAPSDVMEWYLQAPNQALAFPKQPVNTPLVKE